ncbi:hypothetical protein ACD578_15870 [Microvirga sp. RSM25]|uniref:hypothetical protein n=1 Tax=Microvirga sp. RSM25 TaxID=3273802 RepID=UPI00384AFE64
MTEDTLLQREGRGKKGGPGKPFEPGNSGRPQGSRNKTTLALEALLDGEAEEITRKVIELAKDGESMALKMAMDRILPPRRDRPVNFALPKLETPADAIRAAAAIAAAVAAGELTPMEAGEMAKLVESFTRAFEVHDIDKRLSQLEAERGS